jgi:hypothetical protein
MKKHTILAFAVAAATAVTLACSKSPAAPTSPAGTPPVSGEVGPDGSTLKVGAPTLVSPVGGIEVSDRSPDLVLNNVSAKFANVALSYVFQVVDEDGVVVYTSPAVPAGANGQTRHEVNKNLDFNEGHTWRAWAVYQGQRGPRSSIANFKVFSLYGVSCAFPGSQPIDVVACRFEQHGGTAMDHEETIQFMKEVAFDLNQLNLSDKGGFGIAVKTTGNNCLGYSCDILCEGNGDDQNQYDILIDERIPNWAEVSEVTVRFCEIIK